MLHGNSFQLVLANAPLALFYSLQLRKGDLGREKGVGQDREPGPRKGGRDRKKKLWERHEGRKCALERNKCAKLRNNKGDSARSF